MPCDRKNEGTPSVPFAAYESEMTRNERHIKRLITALIVAVAAIFASNAAWLYAWCQYDYASAECVVEINGTDGGNANYIGNDGDIINGENQGYQAQQNQDAQGRKAAQGADKET